VHSRSCTLEELNLILAALFFRAGRRSITAQGKENAPEGLLPRGLKCSSCAYGQSKRRQRFLVNYLGIDIAI